MNQLVKISHFILLIIVFFFVFAIFNVKIWDPDFWWHLKTGEYIYQIKALPENDPFAFTSLPKDPIKPESKRIDFILSQYWLAQVIFYVIYKLLGFQGIIYMRALILTLLILLIYRGIRREGTGFYVSLLLIMPAIIIFSNFTGERPQLFSFLFTFLIIYLLEGFKKTSIGDETTIPTTKINLRSYMVYLIPLPIIMLIWANMHGGFILGNIVIICYIISETIKKYVKFFGKPLSPSSLKLLIIFGIISVFASLVNPNGYNVVPVLIELNKSLYMKMIVEAKSPLVFLKFGYYTQELITFLILLLSGIILFLVNIRRLDLTDAVIFTFFASMSLSAARVIPFFTPVGILIITKYGIKIYKKITESERLSSVHKISEKVLSFLNSPKINTSLSLLISIILFFILNNGTLFHEGIRKERYPEGAAQFLRENKIPGDMYNPYLWGGYLLWNLYPEYKVFIDGRGLIEEIFFQADKISGASSINFAGIPEWKAMLNAYDVNFIVTFSVADFTGRLVPLITALYHDPEWHLIYMDNNSVIFIRDNPQNEEIIKKFSMPKEWVWNEVITEAAIKASKFRKNANFYITMGDAFFTKGSYIDAKSAYLKAWEIDPGNITVKEKLEMINTLSSIHKAY